MQRRRPCLAISHRIRRSAARLGRVRIQPRQTRSGGRSDNKEVVSLTGDKHEYTREDEGELRQLLIEVQETANAEDRNESIIQRVSLLIFRLASGQHFHEGNKGTALTAAESFLRANGYTIDMSDKELVQVVDKAGIGRAGLSKVSEVIRRLIRNV